MLSPTSTYPFPQNQAPEVASADFGNPLCVRIVSFLRHIGIAVQRSELAGDTFLPGIYVHEGVLLVDESRLEWPGDLLHEAGHLAVTPPAQRRLLTGRIPADVSNDMAAIAWSYAALRHLDLDPRVVFHPGGYRGDAETIIENFGRGLYFGVPVLQYLGMALEQKAAEKLGVSPFPFMVRWLCESGTNDESEEPAIDG